MEAPAWQQRHCAARHSDEAAVNGPEGAEDVPVITLLADSFVSRAGRKVFHNPSTQLASQGDLFIRVSCTHAESVPRYQHVPASSH